MKKAWGCLILAVIMLCVSACDNRAWTDRDLTEATSVEIVCYDTTGKSDAKITYRITDAREVQNICNTFSLLALKEIRLTEPAELSYCVYFLNASGNEIESIYLLLDTNTVQTRDGKYFQITDEMDLNRHIKEDVIKKGIPKK